MLALPTECHRLFVMALFAVKPGRGAYLAAAKLAGLGTATSSDASLQVLGHRMAHNELVQAAVLEEMKKRAQATGPALLEHLFNIAVDRTHKDNAKVALALLDRAQPSVQHIEVKHVKEPTDQEVLLQIIKYLRELGIPRDQWQAHLGTNYEAALKAEDAEFSIIDEPTPAFSQAVPTIVRKAPDPDHDSTGLEDLLP